VCGKRVGKALVRGYHVGLQADRERYIEAVINRTIESGGDAERFFQQVVRRGGGKATILKGQYRLLRCAAGPPALADRLP